MSNTRDIVPEPITDSVGTGVIVMNLDTDKVISDFPLRIFVHESHWNGSCVVVSAVSKENANFMIMNQLNERGLIDEKPNVREIEFATIQPTVIYIGGLLT